MNNKPNDREGNSLFGELMKYIDCLSKDTVRVLDLDRAKTIMQTAAELKTLLAQNINEGTIDICIDDLFDIGSIEVRLPDLQICSIPQFIAVIGKADNFEIYPRTDGTLQFNLGFHGVVKTAAT